VVEEDQAGFLAALNEAWLAGGGEQGLVARVSGTPSLSPDIVSYGDGPVHPFEFVALGREGRVVSWEGSARIPGPPERAVLCCGVPGWQCVMRDGREMLSLLRVRVAHDPVQEVGG
jgi:hypothetical protein